MIRTSAAQASKQRPRLLRRAPLESLSAAIIGLGLLMLMQPFALFLYTYSFAVILAGTAGFLISSHLSD